MEHTSNYRLLVNYARFDYSARVSNNGPFQEKTFLCNPQNAEAMKHCQRTKNELTTVCALEIEGLFPTGTF